MQSDRGSQARPLKSLYIWITEGWLLMKWQISQCSVREMVTDWAFIRIVQDGSQASHRRAEVHWLDMCQHFLNAYKNECYDFFLELSLWMKHGSTTQRLWNGNIHSHQSKESSIFNQQQAKWCFYLHTYIYIYMCVCVCVYSQRPVAKHYQHVGTTVNSAYSCKMCDKLRHTIKSCLIVA